MEALYLLIPLSVVVVFAALWIFFRASDNGQFDDLVGPAAAHPARRRLAHDHKWHGDLAVFQDSHQGFLR